MTIPRIAGVTLAINITTRRPFTGSPALPLGVASHKQFPRTIRTATALGWRALEQAGRSLYLRVLLARKTYSNVVIGNSAYQ